MRKEALSKAVGLTDDLFPRLQPHIYSWINTYGEVDAWKNFVYWNGVRAEVVISEPELINKVMKNSEKIFQKRKLADVGAKLLGNGLVFIEGEKWAKHRKLANHAFHGESLKNVTPAIIVSVETMLERWKGQEGKEIEVYNEFRLLTSEVISRTAFGSNYLEGEKIFAMLNKLTILVSQNISKTKIPFINKLWKSAEMLESEKLEKGIQDYVMEMIKKREDKVVSGEADSFGNDFLGLLVNAYHDLDDKNRVSLEDLSCIWQSMEIGKRKQGERTVAREVKLGKLVLPANIDVLSLNIGLHRDPHLWGDDVHHFKPERFAEGIAKATNYTAAAFFPFGFGPRSCVGMTLATIETKIALSMILQRYTITISPA
ncbi:hypothetical protein Gotur_007076, partial [Gossypium turneri]